MQLKSMIHRVSIRGCIPAMSESGEANHRAALIEVLRAAREEAKRLAEMISVLGSARHMDRARISVLTNEWKVAQDRTRVFEAELRKLDQRSATAASDPDPPATSDGCEEV
jgi:hypothetical protein